MKVLGKYRNGNYDVIIFDDGTKMRYNNEDFFKCDTVESMDIKITNKCDMGCKMCHENSTVDGNHADLFAPSFLDNLHPYTELAIGGGNPLEHPDLDKFLHVCKERQFIPSMTVNQVHFEQEFDRIKKLCDEKLIYGLGVSAVNITPEFIQKIKHIPTAVVHIINGLSTMHHIEKLKNNDLKILILGYKEFRRGETLYKNKSDEIEKEKSAVYEMLPTIIKEGWFKVVSFDNLAINQLDVKRLMSEEEWNQFYMGDDGLEGKGTSSSIFVDMDKRMFAKNSCDPYRYPLKETIEDMYRYLYGEKEDDVQH